MAALGTIGQWLQAGILAAGLATAGTGPGAAAGAKVAVVALALWSDQGVFRAEATQAARLVAQRYGAAPVVVGSNTRAAFAAGPAGMAQAIHRAEAKLDADNDVLVVIMTSHGSPDGIAEKGGGVEGLLAPATLGSILGRARTRRKALIVSACYSGIFTALAGPDLLVVTAADAQHPSFGCTAGARWTYFGRAFFDQAMRDGIKTHASLSAVFARAADLVRAREVKEGFDPSNPEIAGGANVLAALDGGAPRPGEPSRAEAPGDAKRLGATSR